MVCSKAALCHLLVGGGAREDLGRYGLVWTPPPRVVSDPSKRPPPHPTRTDLLTIPSSSKCDLQILRALTKWRLQKTGWCKRLCTKTLFASSSCTCIQVYIVSQWSRPHVPVPTRPGPLSAH